ncbi:MAG: hypothetical protein ABH815_05200 [Candidatus Omnitrophota bacterium]
MQKYARKTYFIDKKFQATFITKFCLLIILGSAITGVLLYIFSSRATTVSLVNTKAVVTSTAEYLFPLLIQTALIVTLIISVFTIILTLFVSHKIAGPLYRLKKELESIGEGNLNPNFKLRNKDQLHDVATTLDGMEKRLIEALGYIKNAVRDLREMNSGLESERQDKAALENKIKKIEELVSHFKF